MQRKYSEPNAYIDNLPKGRVQQEELYDDVDLPDPPLVRCPVLQAAAPLLCGDRGQTSGRGASSGAKGEGFQTAAKGIPGPRGNPGFCNRAKVGAGELLLRNGREVSSKVL